MNTLLVAAMMLMLSSNGGKPQVLKAENKEKTCWECKKADCPKFLALENGATYYDVIDLTCHGRRMPTYAELRAFRTTQVYQQKIETPKQKEPRKKRKPQIVVVIIDQNLLSLRHRYHRGVVCHVGSQNTYYRFNHRFHRTVYRQRKSAARRMVLWSSLDIN